MQRPLLLPPFVTSVVALAVYGATLAPDLTWANYGSDGGELITAAATLGVPHPPGYPTYVLLGKLFSWLPLGAVAFRFNLFSAICVALAAGLITAVTPAIDPAHEAGGWRAIPAIAAGLTFALAPLVWGQALISEVYGLSLLCLALFLWALFTARPSWLVGILLGLSVSSHLTALLMLPLAIILTGRRRWWQLAAGFTLGLAPFLALPWLAQGDSPVVWGRPEIWRGWWWLVSGQLYRTNLFAIPRQHLLPRLREWAVVLPAQFLWVGFVMIGTGITQRAGRRSTLPRRRLSITILGTAVLYLIYAFGYNTADALVFTLPALLLCALLLGPGLQRAGAWSLGLPLLLLLLNFQAQNLRQTDGLRPLAMELLAQTPANALLLSSDEATTFTLWYFHHVERHRPDLIIVDTNLFAFDWYRERLRAQHPHLLVPGTDDLSAFYAGNEGIWPLCHGQIMPAAEPPVANSCLEK